MSTLIIEMNAKEGYGFCCIAAEETVTDTHTRDHVPNYNFSVTVDFRVFFGWRGILQFQNGTSRSWP